MFHVALTALHEDASHVVVEPAVGVEVAGRKMEVGGGIFHGCLIRSKQSSLSALANDSGWSMPTASPASTHSSMPQKCASTAPRFNSIAFTSRATKGSCSVGPIGPQMPAGSSEDELLPRLDVLKCFGQVELLDGVVHHDAETRPAQLLKVLGSEPAPRRSRSPRQASCSPTTQAPRNFAFSSSFSSRGPWPQLESGRQLAGGYFSSNARCR